MMMISLLLAGGCTVHSGQEMSTNLSNPVAGYGVTRNTTPALSTSAVIDITIVPEAHLPSNPITSLDADYVITECDEGNTTVNESFTFISGLDGPHHIQYELIPMGYTALLQKKGAVAAGINPRDFVAQPGNVYVSRITIDVGPNQTGEVTDYGSYVAGSNPVFLYTVNVTSDGEDIPELSRTLHVGKYCLIYPGGGLFGRQLHNIPFLSADDNPLTVHSGRHQSRNITIRTYNGGIRELSFIINGRVIRNYTGRPIVWQTRPVPDGMNITIDPSTIIAVNSETYTARLTVTVNDSTPEGDYEFPLDLCYRNLNPSNNTSEYYPFSQDISCADSIQLAIAVK
jgi:hypothetical protein